MTSRKTPRLQARAAALLGLSFLSIGPASADQGLIPYVTAIQREGEADPLTFAVFQVERYDSNFFRLPNGVDPADGSRRSGLTSITGIGANIDKAYGLQRVVVNASTTREFYSPHGNLDDTGTRLTSAFYWSLTPQLTGKVSFDYARVPTDYEFLGFVTKPNPRTTRDTRLDVNYKPGASLHPRLSIFESRATSQTPTFQLVNSRATGGEAALLYDFASGNSLGVYANRSSGRDLNDDRRTFPLLLTPVNTDFHQTEYGVLIEYRPTGQSKLAGRIGRRSYVGENSSMAGFDSAIAQLTYTYDITGKTRLKIDASRTTFSSQTAFSTYGQEDLLAAGLEVALTGKLTLRPSYAWRRQDFKDPPIANTSGLLQISRYATLELDWAAFRAVDFAVSVARVSRTASTSLLQYNDNTASVFARFKF